MNRIFIRLLFVFLLAIAVISCKTAKVPSTEKYDEEEILYTPKTVAMAHPDWTDVTINGKVDIGMSSSVVVKMIKGKSLSISLRPILGMEIGKIHFEGDTVTVVDKYHKAYMKESIGTFIGKYVTVETLQSLFLAKPFIIGGEVLDEKNYRDFAFSKENGEMWTIFPRKQREEYQYLYEMKGNNAIAFSLSIGSIDYKMSYSEYVRTTNGEMPSKIMARIPMSGTIIPLDISYKSFKWNTGVNDSISIPRNSKKYTFQEIIKLISQM